MDDEESDQRKNVFHTSKLRVLPTEPWMNHGACSSYPVEFFFPPSGNQHFYTAPKQVCQSCIHQNECLEYALRYRIHDGVWGGLTARERRRVLRARNEAQRLDLSLLDSASLEHG